MNEITSLSVIVQKKFSMRKMLEIHQTTKKLCGTTYLYSKHKAVEASSLTKLVSFLLTVEPQQMLKIIVEGTDVETDLQQLTEMLTNETTIVSTNRKHLLETSESIQI